MRTTKLTSSRGSTFGIVLALVRPSAFATLESTAKCRLRRRDRAAQVQRQSQIRIAFGTRPNVDVGGCRPDVRESLQASCQPFLIANHSTVLPHVVAEFSLKWSRQLIALARDLIQLIVGVC